MQKTWLDRFREALEADQRSMREVSLKAGLGPNFVQQMLTNGKEPGIEKMIRLLNALGTGATLYVISGIEFSREDEGLLSAVLSLDPDLRQQASEFFASLAARSKTAAPPPVPAAGEDATGRKSETHPT